MMELSVFNFKSLVFNSILLSRIGDLLTNSSRIYLHARPLSNLIHLKNPKLKKKCE